MSDKEDLSFQDLVNEAVKNAREDRDRAKEVYEKMKSIFEIDADNPSTLQSVMLIGEQAVKLIQAISDSNEQVIKAAALKQKEKPKGDDNEGSKPFDIESIRKAMEK